ncbi:MAG: nuclear transport factor 2 family protein [Ferruginibacter sp.]
MKSLLAVLVSSFTFISSCNNKTTADKGHKIVTQIIIKEANTTPTVDIKNFTLITNNVKADSTEAIEILKVKRNWPLAMQRKDSALFESILAKDFTFHAGYEFYANRTDYISNRITGTWTIDTVRYHNLVLQFFGTTALLTYYNTLNGTDSVGRPDVEHYWWADIYTKENGQWKILAAHEIDARIDYTNKK